MTDSTAVSGAPSATGTRGAAQPVIEPEILRLRTQLVSSGHTKDLLAQTDAMTFHIHCYGPKGGENGLHAHVDEDHVFVVLQGEAQFSGLDGELPVLKKNQALLLPRGSFYSFSNEGTEPLVMIRFGAMDRKAAGGRLDPEGKPIPGRSKQHGVKPPVFIEGRFFE
jgi:mannose-6-phosphate isomerase-like protein (cupin superfamily)